MRIANRIGVALVFLIVGTVFAEPARTLDLKPFAKKAPIENWQVPHGAQVLDGIPFKIDGAVLFHSIAQKGKNVGTNDIAVSVGSHFEKLHLLAAADNGGTNEPTVAKVHFLYGDDSERVLELNYGEHLRALEGPWHKAEEPLKSADSHIAWTGQTSGAAQSDKYLRFYHIALANPSPDKEVRALKVESANSRYALLLLAMTVAPSKLDALPDTVAKPKNPFPDLRPRHGEMVRGEGVVKTTDGKPIVKAIIRLSAIRDLNTDDGKAALNGPGVGSGAETDENGHFILPPMAENKLYRLVVWAAGYETVRYRGMDVKSDPVEIRLKPLKGYSPNPKFAVRGRVLGPDGKAIPFALVEHDGMGVGGSTGWGGWASENLSKDVLTDTNGEFCFGRNKEFDRLQVDVKVQDLARFHQWLSVSNVVQEVKLTVGATLRGRVLKDAKPLSDVTIGVCGHDRNSEVFAGNFTGKTGTNGEFVFEHLQASTAWDVYGTFSSIKKYGALPPSPARTGSDGEITDVGDLKVAPAIHIAGTVKTKNGEPLPKGLKVMASYEDAWDNEESPVDKNGHFRLDGLAPRLVAVSFQNDKWHLTGANRSLNLWNPWELTGLLEGDKDDLLLVIEKGRQEYNYDNSNGQLPTADQPEGRPLFGAEDSGPPNMILAGSVVDDATGQPIQIFKIVPGRKPPGSGFRPVAPQKNLLQKVLSPLAPKKANIPWDERIYWRYSDTQTFSNGVFSVGFMPLTSLPLVRVEAKGYEPLESEPTNQTTTNLVLRLKKGVGPNGVVLLPNGNPAKDARVVYAVSMEQFSLSGTSIDDYGQQRSLQVTKGDGKFSFQSRDQESMIYVTHTAGWAEQLLARGRDNLKLDLKPWASLTGTLVNSNNVPMPGVKLGLTMYHNWQAGGSLVNLQNQALTDPKGRFTFTNVPPTRIEVQRIVPMGANSWSSVEQTWLFVEPGITNDLGNVIYDTPPPPPAMERLKQKLGL